MSQRWTSTASAASAQREPLERGEGRHHRRAGEERDEARALQAAAHFGFGLVDQQRVDAPAVGAQHLERVAVDHDDLAALGQAPEVRDHQAADGVVVLVGEVGAEGGVEVGDLRSAP